MKSRIIKWYKIILLVSGLVILAWSIFTATGSIDYEQFIYKNISGVTSVEHSITDGSCYKIHTDDGDLYAACGSAVGYQSRIEMMLVVDDEGTVYGDYVVSEGETPTFFQRLYDYNYFDQYNGLTVSEPILLGNAEGFSGFTDDSSVENKVDAVSGTTVSSHAAAQATNDAASVLSAQVLNNNWTSPYDAYEVRPQDIVLLAIIVLALVMNFWKKSSKLRIWWLLLVTATMGFYVQCFLSLANLYGLVSLQIPALSNVGWYGLMVGSIGIILVLGKNLYCYSICPFGAAQELLNRAAGFKQLNPPKKFNEVLRLAAPTLLWISLILAVAVGDTGALDYLPFNALFMFDAVWAMWILMPIILLTSVFVRRFFCQYFCPVGLVLNTLAKWRNKGVRACKKKIKKTDPVNQTQSAAKS